MKKMSLKLEHCYGIKKLEKELVFGNRTFAIYAPNGSMKTSLAKTFTDLMNGNETKDLVYTDRVTVREIKDENAQDLKPDEILVVEPYNESYFSEKESTLVVEKGLREQYEKIYSDIEKEKTSFIKNLKTASQSSDCEEEILTTFSESENDTLFDILEKLAPTINDANPKYSFRYNDIFDKKGNVKKFLDKYSKSLDEYVKQYESLISQSAFFKKSTNTFGTYQAKELLGSVSDNSFFDAGHSINLSDSTTITSAVDFETLMEAEIKKILSDEKLKKIFDGIDKAIGSSAELRAFKKVIESDNSLLVDLQDYDQFKKNVWLGFLSKIEIETKAILEFYISKKTELAEIVKKAGDTATEWESAAEEFNSRFTSLPFKIIIKNKEDVILKTKAPVSEFVFTDVDKKNLKKEDLLRVLSQGERRALYILNIIFEIRARKNSGQKTLLIIDDIADSFDYKNKYAIVEYLKDISEDNNFFQIILTHNFDFFRTIQSRGVVSYGQCLISSKTDSGITLEQASYINNPFINDWKNNLTDNKKLIASIPFVRNIIEYTKGSGDNDYLLLTSILHLKSNSSTITLNDFKVVFEACIKNAPFPATIDTTKNISVLIFETADECLTAADGINLEHKIVMSIAIRLKAEQFMKSKITDQTFLNGLDSETHQTRKLFDKYKEEFNNEEELIDILKKVNLITPENIHVNSFMYEPILDMGDSELRELYQSIKNKLV
jgi:ABC-type molybdenum transport system ATPase subunit/photorepair protein PhrA